MTLVVNCFCTSQFGDCSSLRGRRPKGRDRGKTSAGGSDAGGSR